MKVLTSVQALFVTIVLLAVFAVAGYFLESCSDAMDARYIEVRLGLEKITRLDLQLESLLYSAIIRRDMHQMQGYDDVMHEMRRTIERVRDSYDGPGSLRRYVRCSESSYRIYPDRKHRSHIDAGRRMGKS
ncbi:MAG: hypothetical protein AB2L14_10765 [Candidatus Xenobiia bacterium LiM19]